MPPPPTDEQPTTPRDTIQHTVYDASGVEVITDEGMDASGSLVVHTTFITTDISSNIHITEDLTEIVLVVDDIQNNTLINQIQTYASQIHCENFQGKGSIDDYAELFKAACKIANETQQIQLDVDVDGFNEFAQAAEDLTKLFTSFTLKLQNVNIINDTAFLQAIVNALQKIVELSTVFGQFKETILATTTIQFPKSAHDTTVILGTVMGEINCAMSYITNFVNPVEPTLYNSQLSEEEKNIIDKAVDTIDNWNSICEQGVSIAMSNNPDIQFINNANNTLKQQTAILQNATVALQNKLKNYMNFTC